MQKEDTLALEPEGNSLVPSGSPAILRELTAEAGISINGDAPWDIQVFDDDVYRLVLTKGSLGFGEAYMDGMWECDRLDQLFHRLLSSHAEEKIDNWSRLRLLGEILRHSLFNLQSSQRGFQVGVQHYDIGNDVFERHARSQHELFLRLLAQRNRAGGRATEKTST